MEKSIRKIKSDLLLEIAAMVIFTAAYIIISFNHEPWFDEAQAWQIAKCASIKEILFSITHYEGHPPLWHLILAVPAKLGVPYEIGLKSVGFIISIASAYLMIFKAPFPLIIRLLLPFNYFIFYQFGIIVRPYGMLLLFLILLATVFPKRHEKPLHFIFVLGLLCLTHSYGIMIACGVSVCYLWEIIEEKGIQSVIREMFRDKRLLALWGLLLLAVIIVIDIFPREDTFIASANGETPFIVCLLCTLFTLLPECFCTTMNWDEFDTYLIQTTDIYASSLIVTATVGLLIWFAIFCLSSKKSFKYFAVPSILFAIFGAAVYFTAHHTGVALEIFVFWLWITFADEDRFYGWKLVNSKIEMTESKLTFRTVECLGIIFLIIPIYWSVTASVNDYKYNYSHGKETAEFLKSTGLENALIYTSWMDADDDSPEEKTIFCYADSSILAYFDHNLFANTNNGDKNKAYMEYISCTPTQIAEKYEDWRKLGIPDVMLGYTDMSGAFGDEISIFDYSPVFLALYKNIYKANSKEAVIPVLLRNDLLSEYDVEVQDISGYIMGYNMITSDMVEAYRNGEVTIDNLVDMMLGSIGKEN